MASSLGQQSASSVDSPAVAHKFLEAIRPSMLGVCLAGNMLLQSRPILVMECAGNPEAAALARARLASAASLGSACELVLGAFAGQLSDKLGRKPFLSIFVAAPVFAWLGVVSSRGSPRTRMRLLLLDQFLIRGCHGLFMSITSGAAISDVVAHEAQPQARALLQSMRACGVVSGNLIGGWLQSKYGPAATYIVGLMCGATISMNTICRVPETNSKKCLGPASPVENQVSKPQLMDARQDSLEKKSSTVTALRLVFSDPELRSLTLLVSLLEMTHWPIFSDVASMLFRDRLLWGPTAIGRFGAAYGMAQFVGNRSTGYLVQQFGPDCQASLSHLGLAMSFLLWAGARNVSTMLSLLMPLTLSFSRGSVVQSKAITRAKELGLKNGEAVGAISILGCVAKIAGPQIFLLLYNQSLKQARTSKSGKRRSPIALPMLFVSTIGIVSEVLHHLAIRARRLRCKHAKLTRTASESHLGGA